MKVFVSLFFVLFLISCGGGSSVSSVDQLPKMTAPVITSKLTASSVHADSAATGVAYWGATTSSFATGSSRPMCESLNVSRQILNWAAKGDQLLCYVQNTLVAPANVGKVSNYDDGNYHVVTLNFGSTNPNPNSENTAPKMKFKITKDGGNISAFESFICMGGTAAAPAQTEYLHQSFNGSDVSIVYKNVEGSTYKNSISITGQLDGLSYTSKTLTGISSHQNSFGSYSSKVVLDQYSDAICASAYQKGSYTDSNGSGSYTTQAYTTFQLLNGTSTDIHTWAVGDGSIKVLTSNTGTWNSSSYSSTNNDVFSWNGDTKANLATASSGMFYTDSKFTGGTIPDTDPTTEATAIAFSAAETWACTDASEATVDVDMVALATPCNQYGLIPDGSNDYIDCYRATGN